MKSSTRTTTMAAFLVVSLLVSLLLAPGAEAVSCQISELSPCLPAMRIGEPPSSDCCAKLKEQEPCLCGYMKDPALRMYLSLPNAKKMADGCHINPYPPNVSK